MNIEPILKYFEKLLKDGTDIYLLMAIERIQNIQVKCIQDYHNYINYNKI